MLVVGVSTALGDVVVVVLVVGVSAALGDVVAVVHPVISKKASENMNFFNLVLILFDETSFW